MNQEILNTKSELLRFKGHGEKTVYNPSAPFLYKGRKLITARVESLHSETDSQTSFFVEEDGYYLLDPTLPSFDLQDPAISIIDGSYLLSGVRIFQQDEGLGWQTDFFLGGDLESLEYLASGPHGMKDIRTVDLGDMVGIFTRPRGGAYGKGQIGYLEIQSVADLSKMDAHQLTEAPLLNGIFADGQWGGVNQAIRLDDDHIGVVGHTAHLSDTDGIERKHYKAMSFIFDRKKHVFSQPKRVAQRSDFPDTPSKISPLLDDVIFPAGIDRLTDDRCWLYAGLSDYCCGRIQIPYPFQEESE